MWKIDRDYLFRDGGGQRFGKSRAGVTSRSAETGEPKVRFRMLDGDGDIYYGGWSDEVDVAGDGGFGPLWDFGTPDAGATEIQYKKNGEWETL